MRNLVILITLFLLLACSSTPPISTKWTNPALRIALDPKSLPSGEFVRAQQALIQSNRFFVVDRGPGFNGVLREQNLEWGKNFERFGDQERYAQLQKLYGVGGIVAGHVQCEVKESGTKFWWALGVIGLFMLPKEEAICMQYLSLVDASSGEIIAAVENEATDGKAIHGTMVVAGDWHEIVAKLNKAIPETFSFEEYSKEMQLHRKALAEEAKRVRDEAYAKKLRAEYPTASQEAIDFLVSEQ